jgi:hypothetical protein
LQVDNDNLADVQAHYEYLADHEAINAKIDALKKIGLESYPASEPCRSSSKVIFISTVYTLLDCFLCRRMNLEIKEIYLDGFTDESIPDLFEFDIPICVEIGEKGKQGAERFHFVVASPTGLKEEVSNGEYKLLRGYILMKKFNLDIVRKSVENLIDHARSRES